MIKCQINEGMNALCDFRVGPYAQKSSPGGLRLYSLRGRPGDRHFMNTASRVKKRVKKCHETERKEQTQNLESTLF